MKIYKDNLNSIGIFLGFSGYLIFVLLDSLIKKFLVNSYPIFEINFFISLFMLIPIIITLFFLQSWHVLVNNKVHIQLLRGVFRIICWFINN